MTTRVRAHSPRALQRVVSIGGIAATISLVATLGGCGQLGPLYLPEPVTEVVTRPAAATPAANQAATPSETPPTTRPP